MFDQLKNLKNVAAMMGQMPQLRQKIEQLQAELAGRTVQADAGAGAGTVTANGKLEVVKVQLDPAMTTALIGQGDEQDREMIEELITAATNEALRRAQQLVHDEMAKMTGGLNLTGLDKLLDGN